MNITNLKNTKRICEKKNTGEKDSKDRRSAAVFITATGATKEFYEKNVHAYYGF